LKDVCAQEENLEVEGEVRGEVFVDIVYEPKDENTSETLHCILSELGIVRVKSSDLQKYIYCLSDFFHVASRYKEKLICWSGSDSGYPRGSAYSAAVAKEVRDGLIQFGYIELEGRFSVKKGLAQAYRVIGSEVPDKLHFKCHGIGPLVVVREPKSKCYGKPDKKGKSLSRRHIKSIEGHPTLSDYENDVDRLNKLNLQYPLVMPDGSEFVTHKRIFVNGRLDCGGRHYGGWLGYNEGERLQATIGGEPVVEIDLKAAHPNLLNALVGNGQSLGNDPYQNIKFVKDSTIDGDRRRLRDVAKRLVSAFICKDGAIVKFPVGVKSEFDYESGRNVTIPFRETYWLDHSVDYYMDQIFEEMPFLHQKEKAGKDLVFLESEIMRRATNNMVGRGAPCFLVHDCMLVREGDKDLAVGYLYESLFHHLGYVFPMDVSDSGGFSELVPIPKGYPISKYSTLIVNVTNSSWEDYHTLIDHNDTFEVDGFNVN